MMHYPKGKMTEEDKKYYAQMDLQTLVDAKAIKKDKKRMRLVVKCAKDQMMAVGGGDMKMSDY